MSERHADLFATVVPVIGLLAETASTGALREGHAHALGELARTWDPDVTRVALSNRDMFLEESGPVEPGIRRELLALLGQYGVAEVLDRLRAGVPPHAAALTRAVRDLSGIDELQRQLQASLGRRADVLKAAGALDSLINGARRAGDNSLHDAAAQMMEKPEMFPLHVIEMARLLAFDHVSPPAGLREQTRRSIDFWLNPESAARPRASNAQAAAAVRDWRRWAQLTDLAGRSVAQVMVRDWQLAAEGPPDDRGGAPGRVRGDGRAGLRGGRGARLVRRGPPDDGRFHRRGDGNRGRPDGGADPPVGPVRGPRDAADGGGTVGDRVATVRPASSRWVTAASAANAGAAT
jgi:hypothetical protein